MAVRALNGMIGTFGFEKLTVSSVSVGLTSSKYNVTQSTDSLGNSIGRKIAKFATITVEADQIRYRLDGTAPDSTTGHLLNVNDVLMLSSEDDIRNLRMIRVTTDATIQVSYA